MMIAWPRCILIYLCVRSSEADSFLIGCQKSIHELIQAKHTDALMNKQFSDTKIPQIGSELIWRDKERRKKEEQTIIVYEIDDVVTTIGKRE